MRESMEFNEISENIVQKLNIEKPNKKLPFTILRDNRKSK